ncbi:chromate transporter [Alloiococcus sp. CFN-8]|uniref:chromate transporter n=1 Tax=Alloiococcus sp. CFN-8 TaxID=3416081 RepID=UPI003CFB4873
MIYLQLFFEFFKTGLFAVGGGMATLPFLYNISDKTGWFTHSQLADMIAISESTPGPVGVNMATYVGYTSGGILGALIATIGLITPSIIIVLIIARFLKAFRNNDYVNDTFYGLRPASTGLIGAAGFTVILLAIFQVNLYKETGRVLDLFNWKGIILAIIIYYLTSVNNKTKKLHPVFYIVASGIIGAVFGFGGA